MEIAALILSIIAILVSIFEIYYNSRLNKTNLKSEYFSRLYDDYLFEKIPKTRNKISITNGNFVGFEELQITITDMVADSSFFKFTDEIFYIELKNKCMNLEDHLLETANKKGSLLSSPIVEVDKKLKEIYQHINKKREKG